MRHPKAGLVVCDSGIYKDLNDLYVVHLCTIRGWSTEYIRDPWKWPGHGVAVYFHHFLVYNMSVRGSERLDAPRGYAFMGHGRLISVHRCGSAVC